MTKWLDQLELWLARQHTHPTLRFGILSLLKATFQDTPWTVPHTDPNIQETFRRQQQHDKSTMMFGWWANGWAETQQAYSN